VKQIRNTPGTFAHRFARLALILFAGLAVGQPVLRSFRMPIRKAALNTINSDLTQEIEAGSTNAGTLASPVYLPTSNLNMLPNLVGSSGTGGLENLLKISTQSPFYSGVTFSGTGAIRASPALTTGTSEDGRFFYPGIVELAAFPAGDRRERLYAGANYRKFQRSELDSGGPGWIKPDGVEQRADNHQQQYEPGCQPVRVCHLSRRRVAGCECRRLPVDLFDEPDRVQAGASIPPT